MFYSNETAAPFFLQKSKAVTYPGKGLSDMLRRMPRGNLSYRRIIKFGIILEERVIGNRGSHVDDS
ncbi:hypothetical protein D3C85_1551050 [compost metagenome]